MLLIRQVKALEHEVGGRLLERATSGVTPTSLGHALVKAMRPLVISYDSAIADGRRHARSERSKLREGEIDVAPIGQEGVAAAGKFHRAKPCSLGVCAAVADGDRPAAKKSLAIKDLKDHDFIDIDDAEIRRRRRWVDQRDVTRRVRIPRNSRACLLCQIIASRRLVSASR